MRAHTQAKFMFTPTSMLAGCDAGLHVLSFDSMRFHLSLLNVNPKCICCSYSDLRCDAPGVGMPSLPVVSNVIVTVLTNDIHIQQHPTTSTPIQQHKTGLMMVVTVIGCSGQVSLFVFLVWTSCCSNCVCICDQL